VKKTEEEDTYQQGRDGEEQQVKREQTSTVEKCKQTANYSDTNSRAVKYQQPLPVR